MTTLEWFLAAAAFFSLLALIMTMVNLGCYQRPERALAGTPPTQTRTPGPLVNVCVPARNEEANIEACVRSLLAQSHRNLRVLVYNDQSTDGTGAILTRLCQEDPRVVAVPTVPLPEGWNGKQWGCDTMGRWALANPQPEGAGGPVAASDQWLLFTDADVRFEPACVDRTLACAAALRCELLSTFPRQITGTISEALAVPMIHFILFSYLPMPRMRSTNDPAASAACGQFILCRGDAYLAAGGHGAFKSSMHDGVKMPRAVRRASFKTDLFDGTELCRVRMYAGLGQVWRGFSKNAFEGLGSVGLLVFITLVHLIAHVLPWGVMAWAIGVRGATLVPGLDLGPGPGVTELALASACVLMHLIQRGCLAARFAQSPLAVVLHPLGVLMMTVIQWNSYWLHLTGRRAWKGRVQTAGS